MKIPKLYCLLGLLFLVGGNALKSETQEERAARVEKIKAAMRQKAAEGKLIDSNYIPQGVVFQPSGARAEGSIGLELRGETVRNTAALLARWTQKEVFVSAQVELRQISLKYIKGTVEEGIAAVTEALAKADVRVVEVGDSALALIKMDELQPPTPTASN